jgi:Mg2+/Co2+ transporter CorB
MSISRVRLRRSPAAESPRGRRLRRLLRDLEEPVMTCLVGNNLVNVAFSALVTMVLTANASATVDRAWRWPSSRS